MALKFCTYCGHGLKPGLKFCPYCGKALPNNADNQKAENIEVSSEPTIEVAPIEAVSAVKDIPSLFDDAESLIKEGKYEEANDCLEKISGLEPNNSRVFLLKLVIELKINSVDKLSDNPSPLDSYENYQKALEFANEEEKKKLIEINEHILERIYNEALNLKKDEKYLKAKDVFSLIKEYKDSVKQVEECEELNKKAIYDSALSLKESKQFDKAITVFKSIKDYSDGEHQIKECEALRDEEIYNSALLLKESKKYDEAIKTFKSIEYYSDSKNQIDECLKLKEEKRKATIKKTARIGIPSFIGALLLITCLLLTFLVFIPESKQNKLRKLIDAKNYNEASLVLNDLGNYGDANKLSSMLEAGKAFENKDFEKGIDYIYNIGGSVNVSYDSNGGSSHKSSETIKKNKYIDNNTDKDGYDFSGWFLEDYSLTSSKYNADISLTARYSAITYLITYELDGGTNNPNNPTSYTIESSNMSLLSPTKAGYDFAGWTYKGDYVTEINPNWIENITLVANWKEHPYSITYELNGGTNNSSNPTSYTIESSAISLKDPSRLGYTFDGWYSNSSFSNKVTQIPANSYGNITLYAKWTVITYSITYELNGGVNASTNPSTYTVNDSVTFASPTRTGYTFLGWYDGDDQVTSIQTGTTGALSLEACWFANLNNLSVISEDISKGTVAITSGSGYSHESITVVATPVGDCVFKGWFHKDTKVSNDNPYMFTMPTNDYSLTAHFFTKAEVIEELRRLGGIPTLSEDGKTVTYGLYPQKNVNDSTLVSALTALTTPESNGWYLYNDDYYAKVSAIPISSSYYFDNGTNIVSGTTYWFKCEPITWDVLSNTNGEYYIVSSVLLDAHCYYNSTSKRTIDGKTIYPSNYEYSDIRTWLNNDFYNSAFTLDNSYIQTTTVDNSASTTNSSSYSYACNNTQDKVFLPSYQDYINSSYGFSTSTDTRYCRTTDWARARGAWHDTSSGSYQYNGYYWTRSPCSSGFYSNNAWYVSYDGRFSGMDSISSGVNSAYISVRPAISINIA